MMDEIKEAIQAVKSMTKPESNVTLFKYRAINMNLLTMLNQKNLYFAPPAKLNDPFDCQIDVLKALEVALERKDCQHRSNLEKLNNFFPELERLESQFNEHGVCSFSTNIFSNLMWSHYGSNHSGVCLIFSFPAEYIKSIPNYCGLLDVGYSSYGLRKWLGMDGGQYLENLDGTLPEDFVVALRNNFLSTKSKEWHYEEEVRLVRTTSGPVSFDAAYLKGVCFGLGTSLEGVALVKSVLSSNGYDVQFYKLTNGKGDFELQIEGLDPFMRFEGVHFPFAHKAPHGFTEMLKRENIRGKL